MTKDEALKLALEALNEISTLYMSLPKKGCMALAVIEKVLAQPEQSYLDNFIDALKYDVAKRNSEAQQQEPVAWQEGFEAGRKQELLILRKIFMDQHEEFKHQHNFWHVAANLVAGRLA